MKYDLAHERMRLELPAILVRERLGKGLGVANVDRFQSQRLIRQV